MKSQKIHSGVILYFSEIINEELVIQPVPLYNIIINNDFEKLQQIIEEENIGLITLLLHCIYYENEYFTIYLLLLIGDNQLVIDEIYDLLTDEEKQYIEKVKNKYNSLLEL
jgi:hypothetical protein